MSEKLTETCIFKHLKDAAEEAGSKAVITEDTPFFELGLDSLAIPDFSITFEDHVEHDTQLHIVPDRFDLLLQELPPNITIGQLAKTIHRRIDALVG